MNTRLHSIAYATALFVLLALHSTANAQVYRWVDKDGKVHYTDTPPPKDNKDDGKKVKLKTSSATSDGVERAKTTEKNNKDIDKKRAESAETAKKAGEEKAVGEQNAEACRDAKRNIADLQSGRPISAHGEDGERKILSDEERNAQIKKMQGIMAQACK